MTSGGLIAVGRSIKGYDVKKDYCPIVGNILVNGSRIMLRYDDMKYWKRRPIFIRVLVFLLLMGTIAAGCSEPTSPTQIFDVNEEGHLWFVEKDHLTLKSRYRIGGTCYVSVFDYVTPSLRPNYPVYFISSVGDSERVSTYGFTLPKGIIMQTGWYFSGASIQTVAQAPTAWNGELEVGSGNGTITARYYHRWKEEVIQREARITP